MIDDPNRGDRNPSQPASAAGLAQPAQESREIGPETLEPQLGRDELLGVIATGVAHEFNNLFTIMLGSVEQLRRQALDERGHEQLERVNWGLRQAGRLARQMLSLAHREGGHPRVVDLNAVVGEFDKIMGHAAGDGIRLVLQLNPEPLPTCLEPGQVELALLNLVRNAADAMAGSGTIVVRTAGHLTDGPDGQPMVEVSVSDSGSGMPPEVVQRAGTSFFTTKEPGRGTGLGLWMVRRFVAGCGGKLDIKTAVGQGTTVRLVFPRAEQTIGDRSTNDNKFGLRRDGKTSTG